MVPRYEKQGIRRKVHGNYLIFYRLDGEQVIVVHILQGQWTMPPSFRKAEPVSPPAQNASAFRAGTLNMGDQPLLYFASTSLIALTLPAERPFSSKVCARKASAIVLATSEPMTRAPMVMI